MSGQTSTRGELGLQTSTNQRQHIKPMESPTNGCQKGHCRLAYSDDEEKRPAAMKIPETKDVPDPEKQVDELPTVLHAYLEHRYDQTQMPRAHNGAYDSQKPAIPLSRRKRKNKAAETNNRKTSTSIEPLEFVELPSRRPKKKDLTQRVQELERMIDHELNRRIAKAEKKLARCEKQERKLFKAEKQEDKKATKLEKLSRKERDKVELENQERKWAAKLEEQEKKSAAKLERLDRALEFQDYFSEMYILNALLKDEDREANTQPTADQIITGIQLRTAVHPEVVLRGRGIGSIRIDYSPEARDFTSIYARISRAQAAGYEEDHIENMLEPLVAWNRSAFMDIPDDIFDRYAHQSAIADARRYRSQWTRHRECYAKVKPIRWEKREEVVEAVVVSVRERCIQVDPSSFLLQGPSLAIWGLFDSKEGFGRKLMDCFEDGGSSAREYEDRIEACLYKFLMANKEAVHGSTGYGVIAEDGW